MILMKLARPLELPLQASWGVEAISMGGQSILKEIIPIAWGVGALYGAGLCGEVPILREVLLGGPWGRPDGFKGGVRVIWLAGGGLCWWRREVADWVRSTVVGSELVVLSLLLGSMMVVFMVALILAGFGNLGLVVVEYSGGGLARGDGPLI